MPEPRIAVIGATGAVGGITLQLLRERGYGQVRVLASGRSAGRQLEGGAVVDEATPEVLAAGDIDLAFFSVGTAASRELVPHAVRGGAVAVDKSSAYRLQDGIPLVVPEVNGERALEHDGIVANPNCCAIPLTVILNPLKKKAGLERVLVSTYQSASGAGRALVDELEEQTKAIAAGTEPPVAAYPYQLAYNVVPGGWRPESGGYNEEEVKIVNETRKILHEPELRITATCVRVPVPIGHGESVFIETAEKLTADEARELLATSPGVVVEDDPHAKLYPTPHGVAGKDEVFVGRIRDDASARHGLVLWIVSDNLRKGAALNAVQIAEQAIQMGVVK